MPRRPRMYLPDVPAHIVHRGNNREACFFHPDDYVYYLQCLQQAISRYRVKCHAYVLMTNHVHLLLTPQEKTSISKVMSLIGKQYVLYINKTYRRSGTLWEGRHKASLIDADNYLFRCYRYIEMNPVRANMTQTPDEYPWSSYAYHAWGNANTLIDDHIMYQALGASDVKRQHAYRELFKIDLPEQDIHHIGRATYYNYPLGDNRFREQIEEVLKRKVGYDKRGRPPHATG